MTKTICHWVKIRKSTSISYSQTAPAAIARVVGWIYGRIHLSKASTCSANGKASIQPGGKEVSPPCSFQISSDTANVAKATTQPRCSFQIPANRPGRGRSSTTVLMDSPPATGLA